ncbi:MAG: gephyrin-like molybdotransferase Glp [Methylomonas sp.]
MNDVCYPKTHPMLSVTQAQSAIVNAIDGIHAKEQIPISQALGRILAESIYSPIAVPPQNNSAMDGYGFHSSEISENQSFTLSIVGASWAGKPFVGKLAKGQCIRILTGATVPEGVDSILAQEQVSVINEQVVFPSNTSPHKNIRSAGSDVQQNQLILESGKTLSAIDLGLLASVGLTEISVKRRLNIGFFSTGDELTPLGETLAYGQIYDSNRHLLAGLLNHPNYSATDLGIIKDDQNLLEQTLINAAKHYDLLISTGGASVGDADFIKQTLDQCGKVNFWKIAIKPGKPLAFGMIGDCWFFGLPGNPVAVFVTFEKFVKPALQKLSGTMVRHPIPITARCAQRLHKQAGRQEYQRGIVSQTAEGELVVQLAGGQDSHQLSAASLANCFIVLSAESTGIEPGETVQIELFNC